MKTKDDVASLLKGAEELEASTKRVAALADAVESRLKELEVEKAKALNTVYGGSSTSDEARAMRAFGCAHPKNLLEVNTAAPRFKNVDPHLKHIVRELKQTVDISRFVAQMYHGAPRDHVGRNSNEDRIAAVKNICETYYGKNELLPRLKAFGSTLAGSGDEWVPTLIANQYIEEFELDFALAGKFREVAMPSNPYDLPVLKDVLKAQKVAEGSAAVARSFGTDKIRFSATKLECFNEIPEELNEDAAPDFLAVARQEVVMAHSRAVESALLNGDSDGSHLDSDTQAGSSLLAEKIWDGLRKRALANGAYGSKSVGAALSDAVMSSIRALMGKHGVSPESLLWVVGPKVYQQIMSLPNVATVDKFGPQAGILRGALASYQGIPICVSQHMREDLNASGVYDGVTSSKGAILLVNTARFYLGMRRAPQVRLVQDLPNYDRFLLAAYQRVDFQGHTQSASEASVCYGYNITL